MILINFRKNPQIKSFHSNSLTTAMQSSVVNICV